MLPVVLLEGELNPEGFRFDEASGRHLHLLPPQNPSL